MANFITASARSGPSSAPLLSQRVLITRTLTKGYAELENAHGESMRKRAVLVAVHEEVAPGASVPPDVVRQHGQETLTMELRLLASVALLRIPNGERQRKLEDETLAVGSATEKLHTGAEATKVLLGLTGLRLDNSIQKQGCGSNHTLHLAPLTSLPLTSPFSRKARLSLAPSD